MLEYEHLQHMYSLVLYPTLEMIFILTTVGNPLYDYLNLIFKEMYILHSQVLCQIFTDTLLAYARPSNSLYF